MPTKTGGETIREALQRLRAEMARVDRTIENSENNGSEFRMGGTAVTQIAYEHALKRRASLKAEITTLEARLKGSAARPGMVLTRTRME